MNKSERLEKYCFRIIGINEDQLKEFKDLFKHKNIKTGKYFKDQKISIALVDLDKNFEFDKLINFVKEKEFEDYGIYISFEVLRASDGFTAPSYVTDLISKIGGILDVSTLCWEEVTMI